MVKILYIVAPKRPAVGAAVEVVALDGAKEKAKVLIVNPNGDIIVKLDSTGRTETAAHVAALPAPAEVAPPPDPPAP